MLFKILTRSTIGRFSKDGGRDDAHSMDYLLERDNIIDRRISRFVAFYYVVEATNMTIKQVFPISERLWSMLSQGFLVLLACSMAFSIRYVLRRTHRAFFLVELVCVIFFVASFLMGHASAGLLLQQAFRTLCVNVPLAFHAASVRSKEILYDVMLKTSYVLILMLNLVFITNRQQAYYYSMSTSYALLVPTLVQASAFFEKRRAINLIFFLLAVSGMALYGARGPLVSVVAFFVFWYLASPRKLVYKFWVGLLGGLLALFLTLVWDQMLGTLLAFLQSRGIYSRTLHLLYTGSLLQSSGRDQLFDYYVALAKQKPLLGWGLFGGWINDASSPHNMLIELLMAFGVLGGGLLIIAAVAFMVRVFFIKDRGLKQLALIYAARNVGKFFFSGRFLSDDWLVFVALCICSMSRASLHTTYDERGIVSESATHNRINSVSLG